MRRAFPTAAQGTRFFGVERILRVLAFETTFFANGRQSSSTVAIAATAGTDHWSVDSTTPTAWRHAPTWRGFCLPLVVRILQLIYLSMSAVEILLARGYVEPSLGLIESAVSAGNPQIRTEIIAEQRSEAPYLAAFMAGIALLYGAPVGVPRKPGVSGLLISWNLAGLDRLKN